jgi:hypothetical protein
VRPIVLSHDQCVQYRLPRTPIKETDRRGARFEARFGEGATELDALEAVRPGELRRLLVREIERYHDRRLDERIRQVADNARDDLAAVQDEVYGRHRDSITLLEAERERIAAEAERVYEHIAAMEEAFAARARPVLDAIEADLQAEAPDADDYEWPEAEEGDEDDDPLFDSTRGYVEQVERYREHQGKDAAPVLQRLLKFNLVCTECGEAFTASRPTAKICSQRCRTKQWRRLHPEHDHNAARQRRNARG